MGEDSVVETLVVAVRDGDGDAFSFVVDFDNYFGSFKFLDLFFD